LDSIVNILIALFYRGSFLLSQSTIHIVTVASLNITNQFPVPSS